MCQTLGEFHQYFYCPSRAASAKIIFDAFKVNNIWQKMFQNMAHRAKAVA
jgi:hypothetical protein